MEDFCVYRHIFPNQKNYIGISSNVFDRWGKFGEGYSGQPVYAAIKKYGWKNIKHEILAYGLTEEEAKEYEQYYIEKYNSLIDLNGYNCTLGGDNISQSQIIIYKFDLSGKLVDRYCGLKEAAESVGTKYIGSIASCCSRRNRTAYGYVWRYEHDIDFSVDIPDHIYNKTRNISVYNNNNELISTFDNYIEAARHYNFRQEFVLLCAKRKNSYKNLLFRFADEKFEPYMPKMGHKKPIVAIDKYSHKIVKEYNSISEASRELNISSTLIGKVCKKEKKTAKGYIFRFLSEYNPNEKYVGSRSFRLVRKYNNNDLVGEYNGIVNAAKEIYNSGITKNSFLYIQTKISKAIRTSTNAYGYRWEYAS